MKNKILSKAYGGVTEARHRLYGLGLPRQWKVITSTLLLLFTFAIGNVWGDSSTLPTSGTLNNGVIKYELSNSTSVVNNSKIYWATRGSVSKDAAYGLRPYQTGFVVSVSGPVKLTFNVKSNTTSSRTITGQAYVMDDALYYVWKNTSASTSLESYVQTVNAKSASDRTEEESAIAANSALKKITSSSDNNKKLLTGEAANEAVVTAHRRAISHACPTTKGGTNSFADTLSAAGNYLIYLTSSGGTVGLTTIDVDPLYPVRTTLTNVTKTSGDTLAGATGSGNADYTAVFAASEGYVLPSSIAVTIGGETAALNTDYTWNSSTGTFTIKDTKATGVIVVTIAGEAAGGACAAGEPGYISKGALTAGEITLTAEGSAESGDTWYWQSSASGTDDSDEYDAENGKTVDAAGTYYLRSYNGDCWSAAKSITLTVEDFLAHYAITYNKGTYGTGSIDPGDKTHGVNFTLSSERFTRAGYVQTGWSLTDGGTKAYDLGGSYTTDAAQEFFPVWAETSTYVASFACGATAPSGWTFSNAGTYGAEDATVDYVCNFVTAGTSTPKQDPAEGKDGTTDNDVAFAKNTNAIATYDLGSATTVTALNVTLCGGSGSAFDETIEYLGADGSTVKKTYTNSLSAGNWNDNLISKTDIVEDVRYIRVHGASKWVAMKAFSVTYVDLVTKYDLTFAKNGGSGADMATLRYAEDAVVTLPGCTFTAPTDKTFDAWVVTKTASGNPITVTDGKFTMPAEAVTATATWKFLPKLTLTAGEGATGEDVVAYYAAGTQISVPEKPAGFSNGTKDFTGWVYSQETEVTAGKFAMPATDLTLTAQWASATAVAQIIGGDSYETLEAALAAVADGQTIQMLQDYEFDLATTIVISGKAITLDLNGKNITLNGTKTSGGLIRVSTGATLNLIDNTVSADATIDGEHNITYAGGKFLFNNNGNDTQLFTLEEGCEMNINSGWYESNGRLIAIFDPNTTLNVTSDKAVLIATNSNVISGNGTATYKDYKINISGGILYSKVTGEGTGAVIYHPNEGNLTISGGTLVAANGPAVVVRGGTTNVTGGTIEANGTGTYKVGDATLEVPADGIVWDFKSTYPGSASIAATISAGEISSVSAVYVGDTPTAEERAAVAVSGGTFNSPVAEPLCAENYAPKDNGDGTYGVKPLATSIDFEYFIDDQGTTGDWATYLSNSGYAISSTSDVSLDGGEGGSKPADKGLKIKKTGRTITFEVAADKLVTLKVGSLKNAGASISVNGGTYTALESANPLSTGASVYTYYHSNAVANYSIKTNGDDYCIIQSIKIEDPYEVSYNTHGGDPIAAQYFYGTALTLPSATKGTESFKGWYDAETGGNLIGAASASYTPAGDVELHAQWEAVSTDARLASIEFSAAGTLSPAFNPEVTSYTYTMPYGTTAVPTITGATSVSAKAQEPQIVSQASAWGETAVIRGVAESDDTKAYNITMKIAPKDGVSIIETKVTAQNAHGPVGGLIGGDAAVKNASNFKLNTGNYVGVTLAGSNKFQAGDVVAINVTNAENATGFTLYTTNDEDSVLIIDTRASAVVPTGINYVTIPATYADGVTPYEGTSSIYLLRANNTTTGNMNPRVDSIAVLRAMNPVLKSITFDGTKVNVTSTSVAATLPHGADLTAVTAEYYWNGAGTAVVTTNEGAWAWGANTYVLTDKDGDATTYTITLTEADHYEAMIVGGASYATLVEAVAAAQANDIVKLLDNVDLMTTGLTIAENITLDLNGFNIKAGEQIDNDIVVPAGKKLTLVDNSANAEGKIYTEQAYAGSATGYGVIRVAGEFLMQSGNIYTVIESDPANLGQFAVVLGAGGKATIEGGQIKAGWYAISNNGNNTGSTIIVSGGELISTADFAIYNPAKESTVTVTGGVVYGAAGGIAMNRGELNVTGGTITSKDQGTTGTWGDGTGGLSNAAISASGKYESVEVEISGGTIIAEGTAVMITNGTTNPVEVAISGGQFSHVVPEAYCAKDFIPVTTPNAQGKYEVIAAGVIRAAAADAGIVWTCNLDNGVVIYSSESDGRLKDATMTSTSTDVTACGGAEGGYNVNQSKFLLKFPVNVKEFTLYAANNTARTFNNIYVNDEASADIKISTVGDELTGTYTYTKDGKCQTMTAVFDDANIIPANYYVLVVLSGANIYRVLYTEAECTTPTVTVADQTAKDGVAVNLIAEASALGATYQWYTCDDELGTNPVSIPGGTAKTLSVTKSGADDQFYKVVVGCNCSAETAAAVAKVSLYTAVTTLVDVTENTVWDWTVVTKDIDGQDITSDGKKVNGANGILANYIQGTNMDKIESNNGAYAIRSNSNKYYQGASLHMHTTKAGMLKLHARSDGNAMTLNVQNAGRDIELGSLGNWKDYTIYVQAGDVVIYNVPETAGKPMRIDHMTFTVKESPDYTRDQMLGAGVYGTICLPNNVPAGGAFGATFYEFVGRESVHGKLVFDEIINGALEAGKPYVFQAHGDELYAFYGETHVDNPDTVDGMYGTFSDIVLSGDELDGVYYFAQKALWSCKNAETLTVAANRAYVKLAEMNYIADPTPAPGRRRISMAVNGEQVATGIENTGFESEAPRKVLINGELYIIRGEKMYDAKGQLVK